MFLISKKKDKRYQLKANFITCLVLFILFFLFLFSIFNLLAVFKMQKQIDVILSSNNVVNQVKTTTVKNFTNNNSKESDIYIPNNTVEVIKSVVNDIFASNEGNFKVLDIGYDYSKEAVSKNADNLDSSKKYYYNVTSEFFLNDVFIDKTKTDLRFDWATGALSFEPIYNLKLEKSCPNYFCGQSFENNLFCLDSGCLFQKDKKIYFKDQEVAYPKELNGLVPTSISFNSLSKKWLVSFIVLEGNQERVYVYFFDGKNFSPLITNKTDISIITKYGKGGGYVAAGGTDNQFLLIYSGYEGAAYLYNDGKFQNVSKFFDIRVSAGGFKPKILKGDSGKDAVWYICSNQEGKTKLLKFWQNGTDSIQGGVDISEVLNSRSPICYLNNERSLLITFSDSTYLFSDDGFNRSHNYTYQSVNLSSYNDKIIDQVSINQYDISAKEDSYSILVSADAVSWQPYNHQDPKLQNEKKLSSFFLKTIFKTGNKEYSPWFGGFDVISYRSIKN